MFKKLLDGEALTVDETRRFEAWKDLLEKSKVEGSLFLMDPLRDQKEFVSKLNILRYELFQESYKARWEYQNNLLLECAKEIDSFLLNNLEEAQRRMSIFQDLKESFEKLLFDLQEKTGLKCLLSFGQKVKFNGKVIPAKYFKAWKAQLPKEHREFSIKLQGGLFWVEPIDKVPAFSIDSGPIIEHFKFLSVFDFPPLQEFEYSFEDCVLAILSCLENNKGVGVRKVNSSKGKVWMIFYHSNMKVGQEIFTALLPLLENEKRETTYFDVRAKAHKNEHQFASESLRHREVLQALRKVFGAEMNRWLKRRNIKLQ